MELIPPVRGKYTFMEGFAIAGPGTYTVTFSLTDSSGHVVKGVRKLKANQGSTRTRADTQVRPCRYAG